MQRRQQAEPAFNPPETTETCDSRQRQKRSFAATWRQAQVMNKTCFGRHTDGDEGSDVPEINLQQVECEPIYYLYIISYIQDCKCSSEIRKRIAMAKAAFTDLSNILTNKTLHINSKKRLIKCYIWSLLTYGCESWTLTNPDIKRPEAVEMWIHRKMKRISWMERVSNVEILDLVNEKRTQIKTICQRQLKFIGYIMREDAIEKLCVQGLIEGKRSRGKQRTVFLQSLALTVGLGVEEWCRLAKDRDGFRDMVVNVRLIQHNNKKIINSHIQSPNRAAQQLQQKLQQFS